MAVTATIVPGSAKVLGTAPAEIVRAMVRVEGDSAMRPSPALAGDQPQPAAVAVAVEYLASTPRRLPDGTLKTAARVRADLFASARAERLRSKALEYVPPSSDAAGIGGEQADIE